MTCILGGYYFQDFSPSLAYKGLTTIQVQLGAQLVNETSQNSWLVCVCAQHGRWLEGERPLWRLIALTISREQGRHREVGSEGSWRQTCDLMNKKLIRGCEAGRAGI